MTAAPSALQHGGFDSHAHVFGAACPFAPDALYIPHPTQRGTAAEFRAVLESHGLTHALIVGAQPYMHDNRCLLDALAASDGRWKGIALLRPGAGDREFDALADAGVIGIRFNLTTFGDRELTEPGADRLLAQVRERGWFLQIHCEHDELAGALPALRRADVRLMIDHFGRPEVARGLDQPGFAALLELGRSGPHVVKLSGPFRSSRTGYPYCDVDLFIAAAIEAFTLDRCVWGSDWPYVHIDARMDYGPPLHCLRRWLPEAADRRKVLLDTPARLFGFSDTPGVAGN
ncbi:MAG: amidohydrolase family protein [Acidisphaera sp.]|nr:amidohydrolase family protein [Acidisphaera sp.]